MEETEGRDRDEACTVAFNRLNSFCICFRGKRGGVKQEKGEGGLRKWEGKDGKGRAETRQEKREDN